mgnify:CR=1 FL=1
MTVKRKTLLITAFVSALAVSVAAGPLAIGKAQGFHKRLEVLGRMFEIIEMYYVEEVGAEDMFEYAVGGVLENLDPHSHYYTAEEYRNLQERYRGDYFGIGIQFDIFDGVLTVLDALEGGPSQQLGLRPGDQIVRIEGEDAVGFDNEEIFGEARRARGMNIEDITVVLNYFHNHDVHFA